MMIQWEEVNQVMLNCGSNHEYKNFCRSIVLNIGRLIAFDKGRFYLFDDNCQIYDEFLLGIDEKWVVEYFNYYAMINNGRYGIDRSRLQRLEEGKSPVVNVRDWTKEQASEFLNDYIRPQNIMHTFAFSLGDPANSAKAMFMLDRTRDMPFSDIDIESMQLLYTHLNNLHKNFFVEIPGINNKKIAADLTDRELQVAKLLMTGTTPKNIGSKLHVSLNTIYKHIANLHQKLDVKNRQELIIRLNYLLNN
ncbi:helix-turn-helix transcriptional regulator [Eubacteriaceae bacterium ES2]|nr:helix-turn-helix transcriptional regulator [Eubacteriaceae bacterium ES2]